MITYLLAQSLAHLVKKDIDRNKSGLAITYELESENTKTNDYHELLLLNNTKKNTQRRRYVS